MSSYEPDARAGLRRVFVRRLAVQARLGIYEHEQAPQSVLIDIELLAEDDAAPHGVGEDRFERVVDYEAVVNRARAIATAGHVLLAETLAERIAMAVLADPRVRAARVTVEKPDIISDAAGVGVTVERLRAP
ncbi:dihydroneopterin aldolase [Roseomonas marmotae]|uniref:dihydroneopterin aldolase n=1 Tax=Roseomonas marmotae TaxID=2768161 RepID=A0ABS3KGB5_9PROT|nr:dihydroneopterin aldolase [Roseomonas marmotae]MBO1076467.1 dihydroneopterin aldolase [Roseomonas marmotae]QTI77932.1 dihydroneopterin aldolase [Roseomonas marmotae]